MKINSIKISAFRGIPELLDLDLQGKSLLLLGENGTGKSSIIDAIEFFFTGKISHLKSKGPLALKDHGPSTKNPNNSSVNLELNPGNYNATRTFNSSPSFPESLQDNVKLAKIGQFILRRSQILNLINTTPAERYKFISYIIGSDELEKVDTAMFQAKKYLAEDVKKIEGNIKKISEEIIELLKIQDSKNIIPTLNEFFENEGLKDITSIKELEDRENEINEMTKSSDNVLISALNNIFTIIKEAPVIIGEIDQELSDSEDYKKLMKIYDQSELSLMKILKNSLEIIEKDTVSCPLCENKVDGDKLIKNINERLNSLESLKENNNKLKLSLDHVKDKLRSFNKYLFDLSSNMDYFEELSEFKAEINHKIESLNNFRKHITINSLLLDEFSTDDFKLLNNQLRKLFEDIILESEKLSGSIKPSEKDERLRSLYNLLSDLDEKIKKQDEDRQDLKIAENRLKISKIMYTEFSDIKKRKIQEVYDTIKENVEHYYEILHPQESYEDINLGIDHNKKGSTNLRMTIFGKEDEDPRALSSEGHLDSLGLCIFLALFKKVYKDFPLLVLDDVVTTMDSRHRENVCQLLFEEFTDKQFIITTCDGIWFEQLKAAQRVHNLSNKFKNYIIVKWDENSGPDIQPYKVRWEKITDNIDNGDKNCAGNEGRRYLEWLLKDICNRTMAKIPAKYSEKYEVGDLLEPAKSRLIELIKDEKFKENIENSFDKLNKTIMMGNLLSHDNLMTGNVSIDEVKRFCSSIHEIDESLKCPTCKAPLGYFRDLKIFRCRNKKCNVPIEIKAN
ncbi:MAG: AAA family ATPase [Methanobacterium sp.]|jgi:recombinational DNA repair ATPase RecF